MSLTYVTYVIADLMPSGITSRKGLGIYQLVFSVTFHVPNWPAEKQGRVSSLRATVAASNGRGVPELLGYALPEVPLTIEPKPHAFMAASAFVLNLSADQLFALEKVRSGGDLRFHLTIDGEASGFNGSWPVRDQIFVDAKLSDWSRIVQELGLAEILVVGIELPSGAENGILSGAFGLIRKAHWDLLEGRYDDVVAKCRKAIESSQAARGDKENAQAAVKKWRQGNASSLDGVERAYLIEEAVRQYTHLAHHVDDNGGSEHCFSRSDATFLLSLAAAMVSRAAGRLSNEPSLA